MRACVRMHAYACVFVCVCVRAAEPDRKKKKDLNSSRRIDGKILKSNRNRTRSKTDKQLINDTSNDNDK